MPNMDFEWQIDEFMVDCRSRQLRPKTMSSYEQALRLFARWCRENMNITEVTDVTEGVVRRYIDCLSLSPILPRNPILNLTLFQSQFLCYFSFSIARFSHFPYLLFIFSYIRPFPFAHMNTP